MFFKCFTHIHWRLYIRTDLSKSFSHKNTTLVWRLPSLLGNFRCYSLHAFPRRSKHHFWFVVRLLSIARSNSDRIPRRTTPICVRRLLATISRRIIISPSTIIRRLHLLSFHLLLLLLRVRRLRRNFRFLVFLDVLNFLGVLAGWWPFPLGLPLNSCSSGRCFTGDDGVDKVDNAE